MLFQNRDENFEREEVKFRHLEKAIRIHLKNIITYMEQFQVFNNILVISVLLYGFGHFVTDYVFMKDDYNLH